MRDPTDPLRESSQAVVHASPTGMQIPGFLAICLAVGVFFGLIGPLGTHELTLAVRLGYWIVAMVGGGLLGRIVTIAVLRWSVLQGRPWLSTLVIATVMTPPASVLVWLWARAALDAPMRSANLPALVGQVFLISLAMTLLIRLIRPGSTKRPMSSKASAALEPASTSPAFMSRLPSRLRDAELYAVEAEDHYLRVYTSQGSDLILLRLTDAVRELAALEGAQTHRSWWVSRKAVQTARRRDGRATLFLKGGLEVPVSRAHSVALRKAGWF